MSSTAVYVFPSWVKVSTFVIVIVNVIDRVPSCTVPGLGSLTTDSLVGTSVDGTSRLPVFAGCPRRHVPVTVTSSWTTSPALPETVLTKVHVTRVVRMQRHRQAATVGRPLQSTVTGSTEPAPTLSVNDVAVSVTVVRSRTCSSPSPCTSPGPPGSGTLVGDAVLVTVIVDGTSVIETCAVSVSVAVLPSSSLPVGRHRVRLGRTRVARERRHELTRQVPVLRTIPISGRRTSC